MLCKNDTSWASYLNPIQIKAASYLSLPRPLSAAPAMGGMLSLIITRSGSGETFSLGASLVQIPVWTVRYPLLYLGGEGPVVIPLLHLVRKWAELEFYCIISLLSCTSRDYFQNRLIDKPVQSIQLIHFQRGMVDTVYTWLDGSGITWGLLYSSLSSSSSCSSANSASIMSTTSPKSCPSHGMRFFFTIYIGITWIENNDYSSGSRGPRGPCRMWRLIFHVSCPPPLPTFLDPLLD